MMTRKLSRASAAKSAPAPAAASPAAASAVPLRPGGPYHGYLTTNLAPGQQLPATWIINKDGTVDSTNDFGDISHGKLNSADPNNITSTSISHLGTMGGIQRRYPDGSTSTQVTSQGRLVNGIFTGTWHDKFQNGQFQVTVPEGQ